MLKILSNENNNEEYLKKEMNIQTSLLEFLQNSNDSNSIIETLKIPLKDLKYTEEKLYERLLYIFSLVINSKNFTWNDKVNSILENIISVSKLLKEIDDFKVLSDLYFLIPETEIKSKDYIFEKIKKVEVSKNNLDKILEIYFNFIKLNEQKGLEDLSTFIFDNKIYNLISKKKQFLLIKKLHEDLSNKKSNEKRLFFYLIFTSLNIIKYDMNELVKIFTNNELNNEKDLIDILIKNNMKELLNFNYKKFDDVYGKNTSEKIKTFCNQFCIRDLIISNNLNEISFKEFESKTGVNFEDAEEDFLNGEISGMFKAKINYLENKILILYVKKTKFTEENLKDLKKDVDDINNKINFIISAIEMI